MRSGVAALCGLAVLAGCGGDEDGSASMSADAVVAKTDAVCEAFARSIEELPDEHGEGAAVGALTKRAAQAALSELGQVVPPRELEDDFERFRSRIREAVTRARRLEQFARAGNDGPTYAMQTDVETARSEASEIGTRMGAKACADVAPADGGH